MFDFITGSAARESCDRRFKRFELTLEREIDKELETADAETVARYLDRKESQSKEHLLHKKEVLKLIEKLIQLEIKECYYYIKEPVELYKDFLNKNKSLRSTLLNKIAESLFREIVDHEEKCAELFEKYRKKHIRQSLISKTELGYAHKLRRVRKELNRERRKLRSEIDSLHTSDQKVEQALILINELSKTCHNCMNLAIEIIEILAMIEHIEEKGLPKRQVMPQRKKTENRLVKLKWLPFKLKKEHVFLGLTAISLYGFFNLGKNIGNLHNRIYRPAIERVEFQIHGVSQAEMAGAKEIFDEYGSELDENVWLYRPGDGFSRIKGKSKSGRRFKSDGGVLTIEEYKGFLPDEDQMNKLFKDGPAAIYHTQTEEGLVSSGRELAVPSAADFYFVSRYFLKGSVPYGAVISPTGITKFIPAQKFMSEIVEIADKHKSDPEKARKLGVERVQDLCKKAARQAKETFEKTKGGFRTEIVNDCFTLEFIPF